MTGKEKGELFMKIKEYIKQLDRIMAVAKNKTSEITVNDINSELLDIMLKFNVGFEQTCKYKLIEMLKKFRLFTR